MYLAGTIKKDNEDPNESFWTEANLKEIEATLAPNKTLFLNPAHRTDDLSDNHSVFGRDMLQVFSSNFVFVDARARRGLGVGAEMMWAKMNKVPVVTWAPIDTHYKRANASVLNVTIENYIHPFVLSLSDVIVSSPKEGALWMKQYLDDPSSFEIKDADHVKSAMKHYKASQLEVDLPMQSLMNSCESFKNRVESLSQAETITS
ncbi:MAG: hypothetical protein S4CHLAM37_04120 [Chlamydiia bacterium]|nr:hypothetical protein [Chlamydiia bacterium]